MSATRTTPILETDRLLFRRLRPDDLDELHAVYRDADVRRYIPESVLTREQRKAELDWFVGGDPAHPDLGL